MLAKKVGKGVGKKGGTYRINRVNSSLVVYSPTGNLNATLESSQGTYSIGLFGGIQLYNTKKS